jgi:MFS family permease
MADERRQLRLALVASTVGTAIEWYDFFLYGTAAALIFPDVFFPESSVYAGTLAAFGTYAVGFAARPVGAAIFGHFGDRLGRRSTLVATLVLMGSASFLIGVVPTHAAIGLWAAVLLTVLRIIQGIGVGGEWGGSVLLAVEWGRSRPRGLIASAPQLGVPLGLLLANGAVFLTRELSGESWESWGWRVPFLFSLVLVGFGLWVRLAVLETPLFSRLATEGRTARAPVREVLRENRREVVLSALVRVSEQTPFYVFTAFVLAYGTDELSLSEPLLLAAVLTAAGLALVTIPGFAYLSDLVGRRRVYGAGAALTVLWAFPCFALLDTRIAAIVFVAIAISLIPHDMQYGPQAALIAETFPTRVRYSGAGLGYQLASVVAGGPAPLVATWLLHHWGGYAVATYVASTGIVSLLALSRLPERARVDLGELDLPRLTPAKEAPRRSLARRRDSRRRRPVAPSRARRRARE